MYRPGFSMKGTLSIIVFCALPAALLLRHLGLTNDHDLEADGWQNGQMSSKGRTEPQSRSTVLPSSSNPAGQDTGTVWHTRIGLSKFFGCDRSEFHADVCSIRGDVHMNATNSSFFWYSNNDHAPLMEEKVKPYPRKWEKPIMEEVREITLTGVNSVMTNFTLPDCQFRHKVPAIVFSTGGYTGNLFHEFNDGIIPLFITSQHLKGEVVFIIADFHNWWMSKYNEIIRQLSKYPVINFDNETKIHCFPEVTVGLIYHSDMAIDPLRMPNGESVKDFRSMIDEAYKTEASGLQLGPSDRPLLVLLARDHTRVILNQDKLVELGEQLGFHVLIWKPNSTTMLRDTYCILNKTDIVMGVHGAALTHVFFMRPGTVFIQIIPWGTDWAAETYFGCPAIAFGLQYIEYKIGLQESTLSLEYAANDSVLLNPRTVIKQGWGAFKKIYLEGQNIHLDIARMNKTLNLAKHKLTPLVDTSLHC